MKFLKFLIVLFALSFGCGKAPVPPSGKPLVLVSIAPYKFFAEKIGGDAIEVVPIVPSNADPHVFEPTVRQIGEIARGKIWFRIGEPFEEKVASALKNKVAICDLHPEWHSWVSPKAVLEQAEEMARVLSTQFPEQAEEFQKNLSAFREQLQALDQEIRTTLEPVQHRVLLVSHPAFGPFCRDYGIEQLSLEEEGKEVRPKHLEELLQKASESQVQFALSLPQHSPKGMELIAERLHLPILSIDPYTENYFEMMRSLARSLAGQP